MGDIWLDVVLAVACASAFVAALVFGLQRALAPLADETEDVTAVDRPARHPDNAAAAIAVAYTGARLVTVGENLLGIAQLLRAAEARVGDDIRERIAQQLDETSAIAKRGALEVREAT